jgi:DNA repair exonuclease SbcCD nuclease subunit
MKLLLIGDPHLQISKLNLSLELLKWIEQLVVEHRPTALVNMGDTFHNHAVLRSELLTEFRRHVESCLKVVDTYYYVLGNHDQFKPDSSKYHALQTFNIPNFQVIDERFDIENITFVPYIHNIQDFPTNTREVCIAHQTFVGADYGFYRPDVGVDADKLDADIVISGHVHKRQSFGKVTYPGTPVAHSMDDLDQVKGVYLFDTETHKFTFIESPFPMWRSVKLEVSPELNIKEIHSILVNTLTKKDNWYIELTGPKAEVSAYIDSKQWKTLFELCLSLRVKPVYIDKEKLTKTRLVAVSVRDVICEYIDKIYNGSLDKTDLKDTALELFSKADKG